MPETAASSSTLFVDAAVDATPTDFTCPLSTLVIAVARSCESICRASFSSKTTFHRCRCRHVCAAAGSGVVTMRKLGHFGHGHT